jgi:hypothetical protein
MWVVVDRFVFMCYVASFLIQTISDLMGFESAALHSLEASVSARSASTAERRQYLQHVVCMMPISVSFSLMCVGAIVAHFSLTYASSASEKGGDAEGTLRSSGALSMPLLLSAASALKAALGCSTPAAEGAATEGICVHVSVSVCACIYRLDFALMACCCDIYFLP